MSHGRRSAGQAGQETGSRGASKRASSPDEAAGDLAGRLTKHLPDTDQGQPAAPPGGAGKIFDHGHYDIRIARDGRWYYRGSVIGRKALVKLFATVLKRDQNGQYWLATPVEKGRIDVDDAPFTAISVTPIATDPQVLQFETNLGDLVTAGAENPIRVAYDRQTGEPSPYVTVRDGLEALVTRAAYYELVELGEVGRGKGAGQLGVWSEGIFFLLGPLEHGGQSG